MEDKIVKELKDPQGRCWLTVPTSCDRWLFEELAQDVTTRELMLMPEVTEPQLAWDRLLQHRLVGMWLIQPNYRGIMQEPVGLLLTEPDSISCEALDRNLSVAVLPQTVSCLALFDQSITSGWSAGKVSSPISLIGAGASWRISHLQVTPFRERNSPWYLLYIMICCLGRSSSGALPSRRVLLCGTLLYLHLRRCRPSGF